MYRLVILLAVLLPACSLVTWDGKASSGQANNGQKSSRGNPPVYEVFGERYYVLNSSHGYRERGVASWYGKKFHGKPTSSGEIYDMYDMTAAHKTLPLPTTVRVTNLRNGRSVIVKVNDRGPFIDNRIIDLSYAAARQLDMITNGTAFVAVESLSIDTDAVPLSAAVRPESTPDEITTQLYLQIGAFGEQVNARQLQQQLETSGLANVVIRYDNGNEPALYRVRLGPITGIDEYDALIAKMAAMQIAETHLVTESMDARVEGISATIARDPTGG